VRLRAIALEPKNIEPRQKLSLTLMGLAEVYGSLADREGSLRVWQAHLENDLKMIELQPNDPGTYYTASAHSEDLATGLNQFNRTAESEAALNQSLQWAEKAAALQKAAPLSSDGQVLLVTILMEKAALLDKMEKDDEALDVYQAASDLAQQTYYADNTKRFAFNHASRIHRYMADIYAARGDWQKFLECSQFSLNWISEHRDNRALWVNNVQPTTTYYLARVAIGLNKLGQRATAMADMDQAIRQYDQQLSNNANHGEDIIYAWEFLNPAADFYVEIGQVSKAVGLWNNYIEMVNPFVTRNRDDTSSLGYLAEAYERRGDALAIYWPANDSFEQTNVSSMRAALTSYQAGLDRRHRILQLDPTNQAHIDAEKSLALKISRLAEKVR
jgi:tetratricopeptide (TPR) repeat protein